MQVQSSDIILSFMMTSRSADHQYLSTMHLEGQATSLVFNYQHKLYQAIFINNITPT